MTWFSELVGRVRALLRRRSEDRELEEELRFHIEMDTERGMREGLSRREARRRALVRFGGVERTKEAVRDARGTRGLEDLATDIRHAIRRLRRSPGLTAAIVLTFGLGIGATTVTFGVLDRMFLRPPEHVRSPERVKRLLSDRYLEWMGRRYVSQSASVVALDAMETVQAFEAVAAWAPHPVVVGQGSEALEVDGVLVSHDYFTLLGVRPALGRFFVESDDRRGVEPTAVLSHGFWQRRYGGSADVVGRTLDLGWGAATIIGVAPREFTGVELAAVDIWLPLRAAGPAYYPDQRWFSDPGWTWLRLVVRLAPETSAEGAGAAATTAYRRTHAEEDPDAQVIVAPLLAARGPTAPAEAGVATWLFGVAVVVLLIVAANIANMLLARGVRRRRETGVRIALGALRGRLVRESMLESLLLSGLGAIVALALAAGLGAGVARALLPEAAHVGTVNGRVLLFAAGAAILAALVAGLLPALQSTRADVLDALKGGSRSGSARVGGTRKALAVGQVALSALLLVGAGLFLRSLHAVSRVDLGFNVDRMALVQPLFREGTDDAVRAAILRSAVERLGRHPAVAEATLSSGSIPFVRSTSMGLYIPDRAQLPDGWQATDMGGALRAVPPGGGPYVTGIEPEYLATLGLRLIHGRPLHPGDRDGSPPVVLVNRTLARWLDPDGDPVGRCLQVGSTDGPCRTVVGVVENTHRNDLVEEPSAQLYIPLAQRTGRPPDAILVRGRENAAGFAAAVRSEVLAAGSAIRFPGVRSFRQILDPQTRPWRVGALLFTVFGLLARVVAAIGVYAVLAFTVAQRKRELGVRAALGATGRDLGRLVIGDSLRLIALGLAVGLALALIAGPWVQPLLHQVAATDPWVFLGVPTALAVIGILAAAIPARRAITLEPQEALGVE